MIDSVNKKLMRGSGHGSLNNILMQSLLTWMEHFLEREKQE